MTVAVLQAGMLFQFGFNCCLLRYLLAALLVRDEFMLDLRSRESFCVQSSLASHVLRLSGPCAPGITGQVVFARAAGADFYKPVAVASAQPARPRMLDGMLQSGAG